MFESFSRGNIAVFVKYQRTRKLQKMTFKAAQQVLMMSLSVISLAAFLFTISWKVITQFSFSVDQSHLQTKLTVTHLLRTIFIIYIHSALIRIETKMTFSFQQTYEISCILTKFAKLSKKCNFATLSVFAKILGENKRTLWKNSKYFPLPFVIAPVLHIFSRKLSGKHILSRKCSHKQIFCGKSAKIS